MDDRLLSKTRKGALGAPSRLRIDGRLSVATGDDNAELQRALPPRPSKAFRQQNAAKNRREKGRATVMTTTKGTSMAARASLNRAPSKERLPALKQRSVGNDVLGETSEPLATNPRLANLEKSLKNDKSRQELRHLQRLKIIKVTPKLYDEQEDQRQAYNNYNLFRTSGAFQRAGDRGHDFKDAGGKPKTLMRFRTLLVNQDQPRSKDTPN